MLKKYQITALIMASTILLACQPESPSLRAASAVKSATSAPAKLAPTVDDHQTQRIQVVLEWEHLQAEILTAPDYGSLEQVLVQTGQYVKAGQWLAQFKPNAAATVKRISTSTADQTAKAAAYQKWQQDKKLQAQGFISEAAVAKSEAAYRLAAQAKTTVTQAAAATAPSQPIWLEAPFNGVIKPFTVSAGSKVKNGQQLFTIEPKDSKRIKIIVAQENNRLLQVGQRLHVHNADDDIWLQISELPTNIEKQYTVAYATWPTDLPKINLDKVMAEIVLYQVLQN